MFLHRRPLKQFLDLRQLQLYSSVVSYPLWTCDERSESGFWHGLSRSPALILPICKFVRHTNMHVHNILSMDSRCVFTRTSLPCAVAHPNKGKSNSKVHNFHTIGLNVEEPSLCTLVESFLIGMQGSWYLTITNKTESYIIAIVKIYEVIF